MSVLKNIQCHDIHGTCKRYQQRGTCGPRRESWCNPGKVEGTMQKYDKGRAGNGAFPKTHWSVVLAARETDRGIRDQAYDVLCERYWKPVYCFIRRCGFGEEDAQDLVQDFFVDCLTRNAFAQADPALGRFRNFLLKSLKNFKAKAHRAANAQKRKPAGGVVPIDDLPPGARAGLKSPDSESPEDVYHRVWSITLIERVLRRLEGECHATGKQIHYEIFRQRIVLPVLEGTRQPPIRELAARLNLTEKQAANRLLAARRAYQRLMVNEIRNEVDSEADFEAELRELLYFIGDTRA